MSEILNNEIREEKYTVKRFNSFDDLLNEDKGDAQEIGMGESVTIKRNEDTTVYSYGANPCLIVVSEQENGDCIVFHSNADEFTDQEEEIIKNSKRGICGGGFNSLVKHENFLKENNIEVKKWNKQKDDFNIIVVNEVKKDKSKMNIYYYYGNILDD